LYYGKQATQADKQSLFVVKVITLRGGRVKRNKAA
jgi:hypothetical protein